MGALICENCGAPLEITIPGKSAKCPYCRTNYTLPMNVAVDEEALLQAAPFMEGGKNALSDKQFSNAASYFDTALQICPNYGKAYLLRGLCDLKISDIGEIDPKNRKTLFDVIYISKAMTFFSDDEREEFLKKSGMTFEDYKKEFYIRNWKKRTLEVRQAFNEAYQKKHPISCENISQQLTDVSSKYKEKADELQRELDRVDNDIKQQQFELATNSSRATTNLIYSASIEVLKSKRAELLREIKVLNETAAKEQGEVLSSVKVKTEETDIQSVKELAELFPIPELVMDQEALLNERIADICMSRYEPFTLEEILAHPLIGTDKDKRVLSSIKRAVNSKELFSFENKGITYYMPTDIAWIFAPDKVL